MPTQNYQNFASPKISNKKIVMSTPCVDNKIVHHPSANFLNLHQSPLQSPQIKHNSAPQSHENIQQVSDKSKDYEGVMKYFPTTHHFRNLTASLGQACTTCEKKIGFRKQAKICIRCKAVCHNQCFNGMPNPCFQFNQSLTPSKTLFRASKELKLTDYCGQNNPCIPGVIVHLLIQIERRGLDFIGLYTMNGSQKTLRNLMDKFYQTNIIPNFSIVSDIGVLTDCVKDFFTKICDCVIPTSVWTKICRACINDNHLELVRLLGQIKQPYRDTLILMTLHFQKVCKHSKSNKTSPEILARVFGDILASYKQNETTDSVQYFNKQVNQIKILQNLIELPTCALLRIFETNHVKMLKSTI